uniref:Tachykinin-related peptide 6 n=6 Tax=Pentatomomorpha TaxID=33357 RepID=TRP6_NEZVI|nr:RecName: Full=Tachykinin-related peptide 6; Short=TKRP-6 [Acrosternum hilare]P86568.1 RecName: Full=Tachykinin-related peptide 6; Short=TKRP-6 [Banasa dimiata]P86574.1 RecName: Full=Tachykinin-related peptide 6; Short=TKRP-6 [Euschistus servus]P86580.1 RecName: Full=Tachykinin-related peptide 6; Short=TKRP-6 [Nezara viridula]P86581.1 RecName: Full=Tachykinin-related peptide 6; Short=TKRP-6 [Oncopeltus fasciatus]P86592.1 RecName: Full=Tachykinin-related peptide 6; Short=TKRP-6 [Pentatoma ruf
APSMGFMGMR